MGFPVAVESLTRLRDSLESLPGLWPLTGGVVTLASRDGVIAVLPFGTAGVGSTERVHADHLFEIGSISKIFTGLMVLALVEEGRCDLDAPITRYLPWFAVRSDFAPITLRHLLHHTTGLVKGADDPPDALGQCWSLRDSQTGSPPGSFFHYSNLGYILLGLAITAITGEAAADRGRATLLAPLGMRRSIARITNDDRPHLAGGTMPAADDRPWVPGAPLAPAPWLEVEAADGNIAASGADMGRFLRMLLAGGRIDGQAIVSAQSFARLTGDLALGGEDWTEGFGALPVTSSQYGLGINVETIAGRRCLSHGGGMIGYSSFVLADPEADLGIAVLTNGNGDYPIGQVIARLAHGLLTAPAVPPPSLDLGLGSGRPGFVSAMLGTFHGALGEVCIAAEPEGLIITCGGVAGRVFRSWSTRFATDHPALRRFPLNFTDGAEGPVWTWGGDCLRRDPPKQTKAETSPLAAHIGRYRSYSPWFPTFRLVLRAGRLVLIAPGGVEAPSEDMDLIAVAPGIFRIGADERLPERLLMGPEIDGRTVWVLRDGCRYSRMSTD